MPGLAGPAGQPQSLAPPASQAIQAHRFWSERAQAETALALARPATLDAHGSVQGAVQQPVHHAEPGHGAEEGIETATIHHQSGQQQVTQDTEPQRAFNKSWSESESDRDEGAVTVPGRPGKSSATRKAHWLSNFKQEKGVQLRLHNAGRGNGRYHRQGSHFMMLKPRKTKHGSKLPQVIFEKIPNAPLGLARRRSQSVGQPAKGPTANLLKSKSFSCGYAFKCKACKSSFMCCSCKCAWMCWGIAAWKVQSVT